MEKVYLTDFSLVTLPAHLKEASDLWDGVLSAKRDLVRLLGLE